MYKITELFTSIEGEGVRSGGLAFFVRLFGCDFDCSYCDTPYSRGNNPYTVMSADEIVAEYKKSNCVAVTVTGGEPLIHTGIAELLQKIADAGGKINVETNGGQDISEFLHIKNLFLTCDYKCPSSGMTGRMRLDNLKKLRRQDALKFVIGNPGDLDAALKIIKDYAPECYIYFSPVYGKTDAGKIVDFVKKHNLNGVRVQLQLHKYIYPPDARGV